MSKQDPEESTISFGIEDASTSESSPMSFIPLAIGLTGVLLGGVAIYLSYSGSGKAGEAQDASVQLEARLETRLDALEETVNQFRLKQEAAATETESLERRYRTWASQTQSALTQLGSELNQTNENTSANARALRELTEALNETRTAGRRRTAVTSTSNADTATSGASAPATGTGREHRIASGDTFARLAMRYGVSVDAILEANPDADPRRLQVGQLIIIPAASRD